MEAETLQWDTENRWRLIQLARREAGLATEYECLEACLEVNNWQLRPTARYLSCHPNSLRRAIDRHPDLVKRMRGKRT